MNDGILLVPLPSRITDDSLELNQREEQKVSHLMLGVMAPTRFVKMGCCKKPLRENGKRKACVILTCYRCCSIIWKVYREWKIEKGERELGLLYSHREFQSELVPHLALLH